MSRQTPRPARLYQSVAERLTRAIATGTYAVGDRLPAERELAQLYSVSRPTMREAIIALELEGLVDVRVGSGVYVAEQKPVRGSHVAMDIGAFELTEARLLIEGEVAALAATQITDDEIAELDSLLDQMDIANHSDGSGELVDRQFHEAVARATRNSAFYQVVEQLWTVRTRSAQCVRMFDKVRSAGMLPELSEHRAIVDALRDRDPNAARAAMRDHLSRVLTYLLDATEIEVIEAARAKVAAKRNRFSMNTRG